MRTKRNHALTWLGLLAVVAALWIGLSYGLTEAERLQTEQDSNRASDLLHLSATLSAALSVEHSAVDAYLMSSDEVAVGRYETAVANEVQLAAAIATKATGLPNVLARLASLEDAMTAWRASFADQASKAVKHGDSATIRTLYANSLNDDQAAQSALGDLSSEIDGVVVAARQREDAFTLTRTVGMDIGVLVLLLATCTAVLFVRRYGRELERTRETIQTDAKRSGILNRFTEVTAFAADDMSVSQLNLDALGLLVGPDAAVTHILNRSQDRAVPEASLGEHLPAEPLPLHALSRCPGIVRGGIYVVDDAAQPLSVHCPIYPVTSGTLACVPLAHGDTVGAVHLYWARPGAFPLDQRTTVARVTEHAALTIGNRRLLAALQGQATTDARTGLANSRAFDGALEEALAARQANETLAVLMLDVDHFKDFNDRNGHPAGDEALKAFANVLRACLREGDLAARYGGEEFAVLLPRIDEATTLGIARRIRARTETTLIALAPGLTDRITVSIGVAVAPRQAVERVTLLRLADEALYQAKQGGRNAIRLYGAPEGVLDLPSSLAS